MSEITSNHKGPIALDFKSAALYTVRVVLRSSDTQALRDALDQRMKDAGALFENEPVVLDASELSEPLDWSALITALKDHALYPIGVVASGDQLDDAAAAGLAPVDLSSAPTRPAAIPVADEEVPIVAPPPARANHVASAKAAPSAPRPQPTTHELAPAAMVINRQLRSGQRIYARNTDLIVIGAVNQGAEVIADGNIHIYGPLRGKAMAGARGDTSARIFTTELDPELVAIAGVYRVIETKLDANVQNRAAFVELAGDSLHITGLGNKS